MGLDQIAQDHIQISQCIRDNNCEKQGTGAERICGTSPLHAPRLNIAIRQITPRRATVHGAPSTPPEGSAHHTEWAKNALQRRWKKECGSLEIPHANGRHFVEAETNISASKTYMDHNTLQGLYNIYPNPLSPRWLNCPPTYTKPHSSQPAPPPPHHKQFSKSKSGENTQRTNSHPKANKARLSHCQPAAGCHLDRILL